MMKRIIIMCTIVLSGFAFAQSTEESPYVYETQDEAAEADVFLGNPGDPNTAPIDNYVPILFTVALGLMIIYTRKNKYIS